MHQILEGAKKLFKEWIKDYKHVAPHSGLGMKSPVEYRKLLNQAV